MEYPPLPRGEGLVPTRLEYPHRSVSDVPRTRLQRPFLSRGSAGVEVGVAGTRSR